MYQFFSYSTLPFSPEMRDALNLTAQDLGISQAEYCDFFKIPSLNCPPETSTTRGPPPQLPALPVLKITVDRWDKLVPTIDLRPTDVLPTSVTCHGVLAAGTAASALKASDLVSMLFNFCFRHQRRYRVSWNVNSWGLNLKTLLHGKCSKLVHFLSSDHLRWFRRTQ
jgi:hypothetical protein